MAAAAGDIDRAGRLLGKALAIGHWLVPLPVLAWLRPKLFLQAAASADPTRVQHVRRSDNATAPADVLAKPRRTNIINRTKMRD
ncbi:hypothetical protein ACWD6N_33625 [Micromonospora sp. NPDC005163]